MVAVAASGGRDSTALLHCTARSAAPLGLQVVALHVHHGLMPLADAWMAQLQGQCRRWGVGFHSQRLSSQPAPGDSVEAWARRERYRALAALAVHAGAGLVLLAHHRRDQAETWLLQALRGGGPAGLAAMPRLAQRQGLVWARPWLDQPHEAIEAYLRRHRLGSVDDASNADPRFARSRLRRSVWPALLTAFPDAEQALTASAARAHEAASALADLAIQDLAALQALPRPARPAPRSPARPVSAAPALAGTGLCIEPWLALSPARRSNALRHWLSRVLLQPWPETLLQRLLREVPGATSAVWPAGTQQLRLRRGVLTVVAIGPGHEALSGPNGPPTVLHISRPGAYPLPAWGGCFLVEAAALEAEGDPESAGASPALLTHLLACPRLGGERFQRAPRSTPRSLKKQYQDAGMPAQDRHGPLLFSPAGALIYVPGLGLDARSWAAPGSLQWRLRWLPDPPGPAGQPTGQQTGPGEPAA